MAVTIYIPTNSARGFQERRLLISRKLRPSFQQATRYYIFLQAHKRSWMWTFQGWTFRWDWGSSRQRDETTQPWTRDTQVSLIQIPDPLRLWNNQCLYLKPLSFGLICYTGVHNQTKYLLLIRPYCIAQGTQYSVMAYMGKESKKEWIYVYA